MERYTHLNDTTNVLINLESAKDRLRSCIKTFESIDLSFTRFKAIKHENGLVGCGMSHLALLEKMIPYTLVLEDDVGVTDKFVKRLRIPEGTDAIYLGVSNHGYVWQRPMGIRDTVLATQYDKDYKRVFNMCSTHAILYISDRYIKAAKEIVSNCLDAGIPFDLGLASIHRHFNILTPNDPWFYQTEQPEFTNFSLDT
jgi:uncharacterized protein YunC (DUF1805 family)